MPKQPKPTIQVPSKFTTQPAYKKEFKKSKTKDTKNLKQTAKAAIQQAKHDAGPRRSTRKCKQVVRQDFVASIDSNKIADELTKGCKPDGTITMPNQMIGALGEDLVKLHLELPDGIWANAVFYTVKNESDNGLDLIAVTGNYDDGTMEVHFYEVKSTETGKAPPLSAAQKKPVVYVRKRLEEAADGTGRYTNVSDDIRTAAQELLDVMDDPNVTKKYGKAEVFFPSRDDVGRPITAQFYDWETMQLIGGGQLVPDASVHSYMNATDQGNVGEQLVAACLKHQGYEVLDSLQNASGNGVDIIARNKATGMYCFVEVKTTRTDTPGSLSADQKDAETFVESRLKQAREGTKGWSTADPQKVKLLEKLLEQNARGAATVKAEVTVPKPGETGTLGLHFIAWGDQ